MPINGPQCFQAIPPCKILNRGLQNDPNATAVAAATRSYSWTDLDAASSRLAAGWLKIGLGPGDRVASLMPNRPELLIHYLACIKAGLVATPLNYRYTPPEIDHALSVSGAPLLLVHAERKADVEASQMASKLARGVVSFEGKFGAPSLDEIVAGGDHRTEFSAIDSDSRLIIYFTSGSTGKPKGVTHTHGTLGWMLTSMAQGLELNPGDVVLPGSSHSHIGGSVLALAALAAGAKVVVPRTFDGDELLPLLRDHRPTILCMLPAALFGLVRDHGARREDFSSLRLCMAGGDKVSQELEREFTELTGLLVDETYGMTEIGYTACSPPSGTNKQGSIGKLLPGFSAELRGTDGREAADGEGRLWIKSPTNMVGYWENPVATSETIVSGWLDTGDMMSADEDGYLWFRGRKKQIIVHDGSNICPQEVEDALLEHPAIADAGVIGVHNLVHGENVRAYVTVRDGRTAPTAQELIQFARVRIGYKAPEEIIVLAEMPLNATGKVDRTALKALAAAAHE